ncbi:MAG: response regulator transcription factor [Proteobacteria bacterium]|nr:response regulator transcription factor [Pseudomonadota bacterium]
MSQTFYAIDDHPMLRDAVVMTLRSVLPSATIVELDSLQAIARARKLHGPPALVSMDINLPDNDSHDGVAKVRHMFPQAKIAVFSTRSSSEMEQVCIASGADLYVEKSSPRSSYSEALKGLLAAVADPDEIGDEVLERPVRLSKRQKQLLVMVDRGRTNNEMALALALAETTVKVHLWKLYRKLDVRNRTEALHFARTHGLIA